MKRLFVYGSLQPGGTNHHVLSAIGGEFRPAVLRGRLIEAGWGARLGYPGLVLDQNAGEVHGHVFASEKLAANWAYLDDFEGSEYQRRAAAALLSDGETVEVQVYVLRGQRPL